MKSSVSQVKSGLSVLVIGIALSGCAKVPVVNLFLAGDKNVTYHAPKSCVPWRLKRVVNHTSRKFGKVHVTSTKRSRAENKRAGGSPNSYHLRCKAVDFNVPGAERKKVLKFLKNHGAVGGYAAYRNHYHIDTGPRRTW